MQSAAAAGVDLGAVLGDGLLALGFQFFCGAETAISLALGEQALCVRGVDFQALGLAVGAKCASFWSAGLGGGTFVPVHAHPAEVFDELGLVADFRTLQIGVLNAE
jgi:hypothetical protein